jgi:hypothetical protein
MSFIAQYVIDKCWYSGNQVANPNSKKFQICVIFHKKCSILTTFYNDQKIREFVFYFYGKKSQSWHSAGAGL